MDISQEILSDVVVFNKYAKYIPEIGRRETWQEICERNMAMHIKSFPQLRTEIQTVYKMYVIPKLVLPSMRSMQFGGKPIDMNNTRMFNCCCLPVDSVYAFSETMFLLLGGSGVGYSVQKHHVDELPVVQGPKRQKRRYVIGDSIEGWADTIKVLIRAYFEGRSTPDFDYRDIRPKGARLITAGGKAPGPDPLRICVENIKVVLNNAIGRKMTPLECHDIQCHIADAVLSGGIRRAAMIAFFSPEDLDMVTCKSGMWWELNPQRGRANNSVVLHRGEIDEDQFMALWKRVEESNAGEPGVYWTNDKNILSNPCFRGDMELLTTDGYQRLDSLVGKDFHNINKDGNATQGKVWSNGVKSIVEVRRYGKDSIFCTPEHTFMLNTGEECQAKNLAGKRLMPFYNIKSKPDNVNDFKAGFILGDGCLTRLNSDEHKGMEVCIGAKDLEVGAYFGVNTKGNHYLTEAHDLAVEYGLKPELTFNRELPDNTSSDFMMGLYSANGSVIKSGKRVALKATSKALVDKVVVWLKENGMTPYVTTNKPTTVEWSNGTFTSKQSYDVNLGGISNLTKFAKTVSFLHEKKRTDLEQAIKDSGSRVLSVANAGEAEVFDFTEPETHWGVIGDVIVHNCVEATLRMFSFCNLTTIDVSNITSQKQLNAMAKAATFIGTLQASYTNFHYLRDVWKEVTEDDALIGVSMTGIGSGKVLQFDLEQTALYVKQENARVAFSIGINAAARTSLNKPEGTASIVVGSASGPHAWHAAWYLRRMRVGKNEALYHYMMEKFPLLVEDCKFKPHLEAVMTFPQKAPEGSILRTESYMDLLNRVLRLNKEWIAPGHNRGVQKHNVSCTISLKPDEWEGCGNFMWEHRNEYNGISVLPYDGGTYVQAPFTDCTEEEYEALMDYIVSRGSFDLSQVVEEEDKTNHTGELACAGNQCEVK